MKKSVFLIFAAALFAVVGTSCENNKPEETGNEEETTFVEKLATASVELMDRGDMPDWLVAKVDEIDEMPDRHSSLFEAWIYKGEWKGEVIYVIYNSLQSCLACDSYDASGDRILFTDDESNDFFLTSTKWVVIYT